MFSTMRTPGLLLALSFACVLHAQEPSPTPPTAPAPAKPARVDPVLTSSTESVAKPSAQLLETLTASLPKYSPPPPAAPDKPTDPEVLVLEKKVVTPRKRPRLGEEDLMKNKAFNAELAKKNATALDRALNAFGSQSAAVRAREEYEAKQRQQLIEDVATIARAAEVTDPAQAKALREAAAKR